MEAFDERHRKIVNELLTTASAASAWPERQRFRAEHREYLKEMDQLEQWSVFRIEHNDYALTPKGFAHVQAFRKERFLRNAEAVYQHLRSAYEARQDAAVSAVQLAEQTGLSQRNIRRVCLFMASYGYLFGHGTFNQEPADILVYPNEMLLRNDTFAGFLTWYQESHIPTAQSSVRPQHRPGLALLSSSKGTQGRLAYWTLVAATITLVVAVVQALTGMLAIPGMPKVFHYDQSAESSAQSR